MSIAYRPSMYDSSLSEKDTLFLFFSAIDRQSNQVYSEPYKLVQLPYLEINNIQDFCSMNAFQEVNDLNEIQSDAYQKSLYRNNLPEDLDERLYNVHILGNEYYFLTIVELNLKFLHMLFQRKFQIPNRHFFFKLCHIHYKLKYNDYFMTMFYTHLVSEALMFYPINQRKSLGEIQEKIHEFLDRSEQTHSIAVLRNKCLDLDNRLCVHIPVGENTGGKFDKYKNCTSRLYINGVLLLFDQGIQNEYFLMDYILDNETLPEVKKLYSRASLIITSNERLVYWRSHAKKINTGAEVVILSSIEDLQHVTYEYLLQADVVVVTQSLIEDKEYQRLINNYKVSGLSYLHAASIMREEYIKLSNIREEIEPVLAIVKWNYILFDNLEIKEINENLYIAFKANHKIFLGTPNMHNAEIGIKLLFGYPMYYQKSLLTQSHVQDYVLNKIMVISHNNINPQLLPEVLYHSVKFNWTYPEQFCINYLRDFMKFKYMQKIEVMPAKSVFGDFPHMLSREEIAGEVDNYYRSQIDALRDIIDETNAEIGNQMEWFNTAGIYWNNGNITIPCLVNAPLGHGDDESMSRNEFLDVIGQVDKYIGYQEQVKDLMLQSAKIQQQWDFVYHQIDTLDTKDRCEICFEDLEYANIGFSILCGHIYCYGCLIRHFFARRQESRQGKNCPACRRELETKHIILYHRHPLASHHIPEYNSCLNQVINIIMNDAERYIIFDSKLGAHDMHVIQNILSVHRISSAVFYGSTYEMQRMLKLFYDPEEPLRVLIMNKPVDYTIHVSNLVLLREEPTGWSQIRGMISSLDQSYSSINVYSLENQVIEYNQV